MENKGLWEKCVAFHGHECGGLTIGYKAALYAGKLLGLEDSMEKQDEEIVCISENDACGVDAVQVLLGCSIGKGNLLFHMTGKQAFSFYRRKTGESVRLVLKKKEKMSREQSFAYYQQCEPEEMFDVKETKIQVPERAVLFDTYVCDGCGELTGANWIHLQGGKHLCTDCCHKYDRFHI